MDMQWWHWIVLGLVLAVAELASAGGFYIIFFGLGAIIVGLLAWLGWSGPLWLQVAEFTIFSVVLMALFRRRLLGTVQPNPQAPTIDTLVGEIAITAEDVPAGGVGRVELRGTGWSARAESGAAIARGSRCVVTRVDGLMLYIAPEGAR
jgi:membrane protein implicated in regulation of membrane protease activity